MTTHSRKLSSKYSSTDRSFRNVSAQSRTRGFCQTFFPWYNTEHHHGGIGLLTPEVLHYGRADEVIEQRQMVLSQAFERNPERFVRAHPRPPARPTAVWINPPPAQPAASDQEQH
jgi:putative transposase